MRALRRHEKPGYRSAFAHPADVRMLVLICFLPENGDGLRK